MYELITPQYKHELKPRKDCVPGQFSCLDYGIMTQYTWIAFGFPRYCPNCGDKLSTENVLMV